MNPTIERHVKEFNRRVELRKFQEKQLLEPRDGFKIHELLVGMERVITDNRFNGSHHDLIYAYILLLEKVTI